jgi:MFS family permease
MSEPSAPPRQLSFAALRHPGARIYLLAAAVTMMADAIEHVVSYWMMYQKFNSPELAGFAVISHWVPFLLLSVWGGSLADRYDPRRIIQIGMLCFIVASLSWAVLFLTDSLTMWEACVILVIHGMSGVFWGAAEQLLIHDIVGPAQLQSGIRFLATSRTLGMLLGPAVGGFLMLQIGPAPALFVNALLYLPLTLWLWKAPYGPKFRIGPQPAPRPSLRGLDDIRMALAAVTGNRTMLYMTLLSGAASFFIGLGMQPQMPEFAASLGHADDGFYYSLLFAGTAIGALIAGISLEVRSFLKADPRTAIILTILYCVATGAFAASTNFWLSMLLLVIGGFLNLSYAAMAQTLVQLNAPAEMRGRVMGLYATSALGLMAFSGVTVGLLGGMIGVQLALGLSAGAVFCIAVALLAAFVRSGRRQLRPSTSAIE